MWITTIQKPLCSGYYNQMAGQGSKKSLPPTSGYNKRKVLFTETQGSSSPAHNFRKSRTRAGGSKMSTTSTTMIWRAKIAAAWEVHYCEEEGSIPWEQIAETQSSMETWAWDDEFKRCWDWDASSGEEALEKAKARYWCKLNGFRFESLKNEESADMYNDTDIDWDPKIDPEISLALNRWDDDEAIVNDWFDDDYLPNRDEKFTLGWGSDYTHYSN
ncbi:hypothetical protein MKX03_002032 [Papaver bracteatum]|nr:hypothetical protein MKX03_002032 [Papaver bracteatum]